MMPTKKYTNKQIQFLRDNAHNSVEKLTKLFNKEFNLSLSCKTMKSLKCNYKIKSSIKGGFRKFTDEQVKFVIENVVNTEKELTNMFNKKFGTNYKISSIENLKGRLKIKSGLVGGQFQKGQTPKNKGKKWDEFMSKEGQANSRQTCFAKGHIPQNHRQVGSERINKYGYIEIKVKEPNKWKLKHRVVWETSNGAIPKGYNCVFLDGNKLNCSIANLALISKAQNTTMNKLGLFHNNKNLTISGIACANLLNAISKKEKSYEHN